MQMKRGGVLNTNSCNIHEYKFHFIEREALLPKLNVIFCNILPDNINNFNIPFCRVRCHGHAYLGCVNRGCISKPTPFIMLSSYAFHYFPCTFVSEWLLAISRCKSDIHINSFNILGKTSCLSFLPRVVCYLSSCPLLASSQQSFSQNAFKHLQKPFL